jgi:hypothetical protein
LFVGSASGRRRSRSMSSPRLDPGLKFERTEGDIKICVLRDGLAKAECDVISLFVSRSLVRRPVSFFGSLLLLSFYFLDLFQ